MSRLKNEATDTTAFSDVDYYDSSMFENSTAHLDFYKVTLRDTDASGGTEYRYTSSWTKWHGYYRNVPTFAAMIDKLASWTIGRGIKQNKTFIQKIKNAIFGIKGIGNDDFASLLENMIKVALLNGDAYAEKVKKLGSVINLKVLNPGSITIVVDEFNMIKGYEQTTRIKGVRKVVNTFEPDEIFHLTWSRIADEVHGVPFAEKVESVIKAMMEGFLQTKILMKRHVQPVQIYHLGTDVDSEVQAIKTKINNAYKNTENIFTSTGTIEKVEQVTTPQYSTIDPLPWLKFLERKMVTSCGVPEVIMGWGEQTTEASAQIIYLAFEQTISRIQLWAESQCDMQLDIEIELEFPASLEEIMTQKSNKDGQLTGADAPDKNPGSKK